MAFVRSAAVREIGMRTAAATARRAAGTKAGSAPAAAPAPAAAATPAAAAAPATTPSGKSPSLYVNKITLIGNVGQEPQFTRINEQTEVARLSVATNRSVKGANGQYQTEADWHNVTVFEPRLLERLRKGVHRGTKIYLEGSLQYRTYKDKQNKEQRSAVVIVNRSGELLVVSQPAAKDGDADDTPSPEEAAPAEPAAAAAGGADRGVWKL